MRNFSYLGRAPMFAIVHFAAVKIRDRGTLLHYRRLEVVSLLPQSVRQPGVSGMRMGDEGKAVGRAPPTALPLLVHELDARRGLWILTWIKYADC